MADQNVDVRIRVMKTGTGAQDTVKDLKGIQTQATSTVTNVKGAFSSLNSTLGMVGLGIGAASIAKFGMDTITAASDASEAVNKMQVVFGNASSTITSFATTAARDLGLSKVQAIDAAGTFGNLFTSMGLGQSASAEMSRSLVQLAADLGSFNNIPIDIMLEKLRSGMVGEVEPLRAVGINLSAAAVKAKALQMGLADANGEVSQAATLQARYAVMLEQSTNAQGDFARTSDGLANSIKTANAEMADLKVQLGELTIKPYTVVVKTAVEGLSNVSALLKTTSNDKSQQLEGLKSQLAAAKEEVAGMSANSGKGILGGLFNQKYSTEQIAQANQAVTDLEKRISYLATSLQATGDVGAGAAQVNLVPELQNVTQTVAGAGSVAHSDAEGVIGAVNGVATAVTQIEIPQPTTTAIPPGMPGFASGTSSAPGGLALVGERGPELVNLPRGAQVYTAAQTAGMMGFPAFANGTGAGVGVVVPNVQDQIKLAGNAVLRATDAIRAKWATFASTVTTALDNASNKAKGLFDLGGGGGAGGVITEPGKGGPFEALYRITDIAATMAGRAPGADTAQWQQMYAGQDAMGIARNFQQGNLMAPGVFENIDWGMLGQQAMQQENASKISTYAGQAVANLTQAGKPLTAEAITAEIDKLAEKDKASLVPELQNVAKSVTDTGATAHGDAAAVIASIDGLASKFGGAPTTTVPPTTPPSGAPPQSIPFFAAGTSYAPGGLAMVGERGPELVKLPRGSGVYSASQTRDMFSGSGGSNAAGDFMTQLARAINVKASSSRQAADALADMLVNAAAVNVQTNMLRQLSRR